jgi:hypothetical protein
MHFRKLFFEAGVFFWLAFSALLAPLSLFPEDADTQKTAFSLILPLASQSGHGKKQKQSQSGGRPTGFTRE